MEEATPRFRTDLEATPGTADGISYVDVSDPVSGHSFRFYDFEFTLAQQLDGRPLSEIVVAMGRTYGTELTVEGLAPFLSQLETLGFLASPSRPHGGQPDAQPAPGVAVRGASGGGGSSARPSIENMEMLALSSAPTPVGSRAPTLYGHASATRIAPSSGERLRPSLPPAPAARPAPLASAAAAPRPRVPTLPTLASVTTSAVPKASVPLLAESDAAAVSELAFSALAGAGAVRPIAAAEVDAAEAGEQAPPPGEAAAKASRPVLRALSDLLPAPPEMKSSEAEPEASSAVDEGHAHDGPAMNGRAPEEAGVPTSASAAEVAPRATPAWADAVARHVEGLPASPNASEGAAASEGRAQPAREPAPRDRTPQPARQTRWPWAVGAAVVTVAVGVLCLRQTDEPAPAVPVTAPLVRAFVPAPATVYRWFDAQGIVVPGEDKSLSFPTAGKVRDTLAPGMSFSAGQVLASLQGVTNVEKDLNRARARLAAYEQLLETAEAHGNQAQIRFNRGKIEEKKWLVAHAEQAWRRLVIVAEAPGELGAVKVRSGDRVEAGAPVLEVRATGPHAEWPLTAAEATEARSIGFCRVESLATADAPARAADCLLPAQASTGKPFVVDLPRQVNFAVGQALRLARARYEGVFPLPRTAVRETPLGTQLFVVSQPGSVLRARTVRVVETAGEEVLVAGGLVLGDTVVSRIEPRLADGVAVRLAAP